MVKDTRMVQATSRSGNPGELLRGPLYYVIVLLAVTGQGAEPVPRMAVQRIAATDATYSARIASITASARCSG